MAEGAGITHCYDGLSFGSHMIAGGVAGTVEHVFMYPVDTIKTRMQALSHPGQRLHNMPVHKALEKAFRREGLRGLYKGVGAVMVGAGPAHAMHFAVYELAKDSLGGNREGLQPLATGLAGAVATITNDALMTPADVVKQRLQVAHTPYSGAVDCIRTVLRTEGVRAFYKSYPTTLLMNIPFTAVHFTVYEAAKKVMMGKGVVAPSTSTTTAQEQQLQPNNSSSGSSTDGPSDATASTASREQPQLSAARTAPVPASLLSWNWGRTTASTHDSPQNDRCDSVPARSVLESHRSAVANGSSSDSDAAPSQTAAHSAAHPHATSPQSSPQHHPGLNFPSVVTAEAPGQQQQQQQHQHARQHTSATGGVVASSLPQAGSDPEEEAEETLMVQLVAGGIAGGCASAITTPFDVVKTRLQTEGVGSARRYNENVGSTMRRIIADEGMSALWRGLRPRVLFHVPSAAVCFGTYETIKSFLAAEETEGRS